MSRDHYGSHKHGSPFDKVLLSSCLCPAALACSPTPTGCARAAPECQGGVGLHCLTFVWSVEELLVWRTLSADLHSACAGLDAGRQAGPQLCR